jgi:hypothetical protein
MEDKVDQHWRKSSYSGNGGGNCVEVGNADRAVMVRDTKHREGTVIRFGADVWRAFAAEVKNS